MNVDDFDEQAFAEWQAKEREGYIKDAGTLAERVASGFPFLTVKDLRKALDGIPDDAPVLYQRIEDKYFDEHHWTSYRLTWERKDEYSEYILSFSAYKHKAADGRDVFVINAHY